MGEIDIDQTRERTLWPWVVVLLLIASLGWYLLSQRSARESTDSERTPAARPASGPVGTYLQYVAERRMRTTPGVDREYTAHGLRLLAAALEAVAGEAATGGEMLVHLTALRAGADSVEEAPAGGDARHAREAFAAAAEVAGVLQAQRHPNIGERVAAMRRAAATVRAQAPLAEQQEAVTAFFERAADALRSMAPQAVQHRPTGPGSFMEVSHGARIERDHAAATGAAGRAR